MSAALSVNSVRRALNSLKVYDITDTFTPVIAPLSVKSVRRVYAMHEVYDVTSVFTLESVLLNVNFV